MFICKFISTVSLSIIQTYVLKISYHREKENAIGKRIFVRKMGLFSIY